MELLFTVACIYMLILSYMSLFDLEISCGVLIAIIKYEEKY